MGTVLFERATATYILESHDLGVRLGLCQLVNHEASANNGHLTAFLLPEFRGLGWPMEGLILFVDYAFYSYGLNKLYLESFDDEADRYRSIVGEYLKPEAKLPEHRMVGGRYVNTNIFAIYRTAAKQLCQGILTEGASFDV